MVDEIDGTCNPHDGNEKHSFNKETSKEETA
jgi:hypothetical protein